MFTQNKYDRVTFLAGSDLHSEENNLENGSRFEDRCKTTGCVINSWQEKRL